MGNLRPVGEVVPFSTPKRFVRTGKGACIGGGSDDRLPNELDRVETAGSPPVQTGTLKFFRGKLSNVGRMHCTEVQ